MQITYPIVGQQTSSKSGASTIGRTEKEIEYQNYHLGSKRANKADLLPFLLPKRKEQINDKRRYFKRSNARD